MINPHSQSLLTSFSQQAACDKKHAISFGHNAFLKTNFSGAL